MSLSIPTLIRSTGCSDTAQAHISVFSLPVVTLTPFNAYCVSSPPFALSGGNPAGGIYSGTGVSSNMFNPSVAGLGTHTINYTYVDPLDFLHKYSINISW
jgi:hypothetical protein